MHILQKVEKVTSKNTALPLLSCVLLEATSSGLHIRATNLDIGLEGTASATVAEEGRVAIPGGLVSSFVSQIPRDMELEIYLQDKNLVIKAGKNKTVVKALDHADFPTLPKVDIESAVTIDVPAQELLSGLRSVWYSAAPSSMKPELSSVYIHTQDEYLVFVATDSFRLAEKKVRVGKIEMNQGLLVPFRNVPELLRAFDGVDETVKVSFDKNQVSFAVRGMYAVSRVIDAVFPDYHQIIPKESQTEVTLLKQDLLQALKVSTIFSDTFNQVHFAINPEQDSFVVSSRNNDKGENENAVAATSTGESLEINFNYRYILDCAASLQSDSVVMKFAGMHKPLVIRGVSDASFTYLVMPMNR